MSISSPSSPLPASVRRRRIRFGRFDFAYMCFSFVAITVCTPPVLSALPLDFTTLMGIGMLLFLPMALAAFGLGLCGIVFSVVLWREWPLPVMSLLCVAMFLLFLANEEWRTISDTTELVGCCLATAALFFFCGRWFFFARKRVGQAELV